MNKYNKTEVRGLPTVDELRASLVSTEGSDARVQLAMLFDEATFVETNAYTKRALSDFITTEKANELEGVITGYGAIDGKLVFAFAEDTSRMGGVIDERLKHHSSRRAFGFTPDRPLQGIKRILRQRA